MSESRRTKTEASFLDSSTILGLTKPTESHNRCLSLTRLNRRLDSFCRPKQVNWKLSSAESSRTLEGGSLPLFQYLSSCLPVSFIPFRPYKSRAFRLRYRSKIGKQLSLFSLKQAARQVEESHRKSRDRLSTLLLVIGLSLTPLLLLVDSV